MMRPGCVRPMQFGLDGVASSLSIRGARVRRAASAGDWSSAHTITNRGSVCAVEVYSPTDVWIWTSDASAMDTVEGTAFASSHSSAFGSDSEIAGYVQFGKNDTDKHLAYAYRIQGDRHYHYDTPLGRDSITGFVIFQNVDVNTELDISIQYSLEG